MANEAGRLSAFKALEAAMSGKPISPFSVLSALHSMGGFAMGDLQRSAYAKMIRTATDADRDGMTDKRARKLTDGWAALSMYWVDETGALYPPR